MCCLLVRTLSRSLRLHEALVSARDRPGDEQEKEGPKRCSQSRKTVEAKAGHIAVEPQLWRRDKALGPKRKRPLCGVQCASRAQPRCEVRTCEDVSTYWGTTIKICVLIPTPPACVLRPLTTVESTLQAALSIVFEDATWDPFRPLSGVRSALTYCRCLFAVVHRPPYPQ